MKQNAEIQKIYSLSPMQEGMLFHWLLDKESNAYFEQFSFNIRGSLDIQIFEKSFTTLINRHDIFKTVFIYEKIQSPKQVVIKERSASIYYKDISNLLEIERRTFLETFKIKDRQEGFHLSKDILMRIAVHKLEEDDYNIVWSFHHIIMDGWCMGTVIEELFHIYRSLREGKIAQLEDYTPYIEYIRWLEQQNYDEAGRRWEEYLKGYENIVRLPGSHIASIQPSSYLKEEFFFELGEELTESLLNIAKANKVTLNTVFEAIWALLLQRYNDVDDVVFGSVVSGRHAGIGENLDMAKSFVNTIGVFINTIPVRIKYGQGMNFCELINQIQQTSIEMDEYSYYPLSKIQSKTKLNKDLITHIVAFENYPIHKEVKRLIQGQSSLGFEISDVAVFEQTNYEMNIIVLPGAKLSIRIIYNVSVYQKNDLKMIERHLRELIKQITQNPVRILEDVDFITEEERQQILHCFNDTEAAYPRNQTICSLFEEQVNNNPEHVAVIFNNQKVTYRELDNKANQLAALLWKEGVTQESVVGIVAERSVEMIAGILGILKAGGAYLPIDIQYPNERIGYMLKDAQCKIILSHKGLMDDKEYDGRIIDLEDETLFKDSSTNFGNVIGPTNLAYIMYTSGSTGKPKGVMVEHRNVVRLVKNPNYIEFTQQDRILQTGSVSFDASTFEIWGALLNGASLYLLDESKVLDAEEFSKEIVQHNITILWLTSPLFNQLALQKPEMFLSLKYLLVGGDVLSPKHINAVKEVCKNVDIINGYGPTENTTFSTCFLIDKYYEKHIPIGKPISNSKAYIVGKDGKLQPVGVPGELYVGGDGVARGYVNDQDLTQKKFIYAPFADGQRVYKTGDYAKWLPDGNIYFLGRVDSQVKIRGYRIELGEIETLLLKNESIKDVALVAKENQIGNKCIFTYYVADKELETSELRNYLLKHLPDYMIPSYFLRVDSIPLNRNGKTDKKALLELTHTTYQQTVYPEDITDDTEKKLIEIWSRFLEKEQIDPCDNFFEIGGDSLIILRILSVCFQYNWNLKIQDFYRYPTIKEIANSIKGKTQAGSIQSENTTEKTVLSMGKIVSERKSISIKNVLLTGATGFLGVHILNNLLEKTEACIYCLVRGGNKSDSEQRLLELLEFYFEKRLHGFIQKRIVVVSGDITLEKFGLTDSKYLDLCQKVDVVVHSAAMVKHYGMYRLFEKVNVRGTEEIIQFSMEAHAQLNHVSTISVSGDAFKQEKDGLVFTEENFYIGQTYEESPYVKSKFEAEKLVYNAMELGLNAIIHRVGNLTGRYIDGQFQFNSNENKFYNILKSIVKLGVTPDTELKREIEFTPVDYCSEAIVKILETTKCNQRVFHLFNPNTLKMEELIQIFKRIGIQLQVLDQNEFKKLIEQISKDNTCNEALAGIINDFDPNGILDYSSTVKVCSEVSKQYLESIGFSWPEVNLEYIKKVLGCVGLA